MVTQGVVVLVMHMPKLFPSVYTIYIYIYVYEDDLQLGKLKGNCGLLSAI